jgi:hypothetical protein
MAATLKKAPIDDIVDVVASRAVELQERAELILREADSPEAVSAMDRQILRLAGYIGRGNNVRGEDGEIRHEWGRVQRALRFMKQAGAPEEFDAAKQAAEKAAQAERERGRKLDEQIASLEAEREALRADAARTQSRVDSMTQGRDMLRDRRVLPPYAQQQIRDAERSLSVSRLAKDLHASENYVSNLERLDDGADKQRLAGRRASGAAGLGADAPGAGHGRVCAHDSRRLAVSPHRCLGGAP